MLTALKPDISKRVFWDIDFDSLDYTKDRFYIIEKVLNYGLWNDFVELVKFYGKDTIKKEIVESTYLKKDVLNFLCLYLDLKPSQFKCYKLRQSKETHWDY
jgi:hypothetical protein